MLFRNGENQFALWGNDTTDPSHTDSLGRAQASNFIPLADKTPAGMGTNPQCTILLLPSLRSGSNLGVLEKASPLFPNGT